MELAASPDAGECLEVVENADGRWNVAMVVVVVMVVERGGTERNVTTPNCLIPGRAMRELIGNTGARGCVLERMAGRASIPPRSPVRVHKSRGTSFRSRESERWLI